MFRRTAMAKKQKILKVCFDNQVYARQKYGGVSRYFYEIMNVYKNSPMGILPVFHCPYSQNTYLKNPNATPKNIKEKILWLIEQKYFRKPKNIDFLVFLPNIMFSKLSSIFFTQHIFHHIF